MKFKPLLHPLGLTLALLSTIAGAYAQTISYSGGTLTENFDNMGPNGLDLPNGWYTGPATAVNNTRVGAVSDGSASGFNSYNYGLANSSDRALGSLAGVTTGSIAHEVRLVNDSGCTISKLLLRYDGEQWRRNGNTSTQSLTVSFSANGGETFSNLPPSFSFSSPVTAGNGALNGDVAPNRTAGIGGVFNVNISSGARFVIRWLDNNDAGNDHGLAIDNVQIGDPVGCPPAYAINDVQPRTLTTGDQVRITGTGLDGPPEGACLIGALPNGAVVLRVISRTATDLIAEVGPVPPGGGSGPVMFGSGVGVTAGFEPVFPDLAVRAPVRTLLVSNAAVASVFNVAFTYSPPPTNTRWFFSMPATNGQIMLVITGRCPVNAQIAIEGSLRVSNPDTGLKDIDAGFPQIVWQPGGSALQCARRICDSLRCAFAQTRGVQLECQVTALADGSAKITLSYPGGSIDRFSSLTVCVTTPTVPRPVITDISPRRGGRGTVFTLKGRNLGNNPADDCLLLARGTSLQPLRTLTATGTEITALLDIVSPANGGGDWRPMLVVGTGNFVDPTRRADDLPGLTFAGTGAPGVGDQPVTLDPTPQNAADVFDDNTGPTPCTDMPVGGVVSITLNNANCVEGTILKLDGHWDLRDCHGNTTHVDAWLPNFTYHTADGSCADVIKAALDAQFFNTTITSTGFPITTWIDTDPVTGKDRLNIACDSGDAACPCCIISSWVRVKYCPPLEGLGQNATITSVEPSSIGSLGTVTITGTGLPTDPDSTCVIQMGENGVIWPLRALSATANQIVARAAPIPAGALPGPVKDVRGLGVRGPAISVIWDDLRPGADNWSFRGVGRAASGGVLAPDFNRPAPDPNTTWVTGQLVNGQYCLFFSNACPAGTILNIQADFTLARPDGDVSVDQVLNGTVWTTGGSAYECAKRICDLVACGLKVKLGVKLKCEATALPGGVAKVTLSDTNPFRSAYLSVCATTPASPVIFDVQPRAGRAGDVISLIGTNFGNEPRQFCFVLPNDCGPGGPRQLIPFKVIAARDNRIDAELGFVPEGAVAGRIMLAKGDFDVNPPVIPFDDVQLIGPHWAWGQNAPAVLAPVDFRPLPGAPPNQTCLQAECSSNQFCLTLTNAWASNSVLCIVARAHNAQGGGDIDSRVGIIPFPGGTTKDCADRLAAVLRGEFARQSKIQVNITVQDLGNNRVRLCITGATLPLTSGWFSVCIKPGAVEPPTPVITRVIPDKGFAGQVITIEGRNFGQDPDNICAVVRYRDTGVPLQVLTAEDNRITAMIGAVPPNADCGPIMIGLGVGTREFAPIPGTLLAPPGAWAWRRAGPAAVGNFLFKPQPHTGPEGKLQFDMEPIANGVLCTYITGDWPSNSVITVHARVHTTGGAQSGDLYSPNVLVPGGSALQCGQAIANIINGLMTGAGVTVNVTVTQVGTRVKIQIALPNGVPIEWGILTICCRPAPRPPVITDFNPKEAVAGGLVTIEGRGFEEGCPDDHCAVFSLGGHFIDIEVLAATPTRLVGRIGAVPPNHIGQPHTLMMAKGWPVRPAVVPGFDDVTLAARPWVWKRAPGLDMGIAQARFVPLAPPVPPVVPALHSGPPEGGVLRVRLNIDWKEGQEFCINGRIHGPGFEACDTRIPRTRFSRAGTRFECAERICDLLRRAFAAHPERPRNVLCRVSDVGGDAVITLSFADGTPVTGGEIDIVPKPAPAPVITDITPANAKPGDRIVFRGANFGTDPDNICLVAANECGRLLPFKLLRVANDVIEAELVHVPAEDAGIAHEIRIGIGEGLRRAVTPQFADVQVVGTPWIWFGVPGDMTVARVPFTPLPLPTLPCRSYNTPCPTNGVMCLVIDGDWSAGQTVCIAARIHQKDREGSDCNFPSVTFTGSGTRLECAARICDLLKQAFASAYAPLTVNCTVTASGGNAKITVNLPGGAVIDEGNIDIVCKAPPTPPRLAIRREVNGSVTITWPGTGWTLEQSDDVCNTASWAPTPQQTGPVNLTPSGLKKFYRLRGPALP